MVSAPPRRKQILQDSSIPLPDASSGRLAIPQQQPQGTGPLPPSNQRDGTYPQGPVPGTLHPLTNLTGTMVIISTKDGRKYQGVVDFTGGGGSAFGVTLNHVKTLSNHSRVRTLSNSTQAFQLSYSLFIVWTNIDEWAPAPAYSKAVNRDPFKTDASINSKPTPRRDRELEAWTRYPLDPTPSVTLGTGAPFRVWDEFAENGKPFDINTTFDGWADTIRLDRKDPRQTSNKTTAPTGSNPHVRKEQIVDDAEANGTNEKGHTKSARILASLPSQGSTSSFPGFGSSSDTQRRFAPTNEGGVRFEGQGIKPKGRAELNTGARELEGIREGAMNEVKELRRELEREKRRAKNEAGHLKIRIDEMREEMNEEVNKCREALNRQRRAEEQADAFKKRIAEMRSEEESMRKEMEKLKSRTKEEVDGLMKCIAEMQSKLEEDQHGSGCLPLDRSSPHFDDRLNKALHGREYERCVQSLQRHDLIWLIDYLDDAADRLDPSGPASRKCLRELGNICGTHTMLPTSHMISADLLTVDSQPFTSGGFCEMYRGTLSDSVVCVKRLPVSVWGISQEANKMFCKEAVMWKYLKHPNILPLIGATISPPQLVSEFMPAGDLSKYIGENPDTDRMGLLSEIVEGLRYLHSRNVIHGDLKGMNVLVDVVDGTPHARIADFGIATVTKNLDSIRPATHQNIHTPTWSAPEVMRGENPTRESDIYSLAMVMIEVLSGRVPFSDLKSNYLIVMAVWEGKRPPRPAHSSCTDALWTLIQRCWDQDPRSRPDILGVSQTLSSVSAN